MRYGTVPLFAAVGQNLADLLSGEVMFAWQNLLSGLVCSVSSSTIGVLVLSAIGILFLVERLLVQTAVCQCPSVRSTVQAA